MDNQIPEDPYRILARERSHEDARQTVATNRMLVQSLVIINGGAATAALAYYGAHNTSGPGTRYDHPARYATESESDRYEGSKRSARFDHLSLLSPRLGLAKKIARVIPGRFYFLS